MLRSIFLATTAVALAGASTAQAAGESYSRHADDTKPRQVFWGDTHLHTRLSADAYSVGNRTHTPEQAFRFARGETVAGQNGMKVRLDKPLDFLVVSDHAEYLGMFAGAEDRSETVLSTPLGRKLRELFDVNNLRAVFSTAFTLFGTATLTGEAEETDPEVRASIWKGVGERADRFNEPGRFTAFVGYEYTSMPNSNNLHRVVVFRDGGDKTSQVLPFSTIDSINPEDLWKFLAAYEKKTGGAVLAIPHNSNVSGGLMFDEKQYNGDPITAEYARTRIRWEPIHEMTQIKGDSETHPVLSPNDEFADYETWDSWAGGKRIPKNVTREEWRKTLPGSYARSALMRGLEIEQRVGVNPYKQGMIGSTDSHTALSTAEEDNFWGKFGSDNPTAERWNRSWGMEVSDEMKDKFESAKNSILPVTWTTAASGLAAVWARENTREALFDSMRRKEVYATTGTRMTVRFFGGWDYADNADKRRDYVDIGYDGGVPMGGDLTKAASGKKPKFLVLAAKDPDGANLDRVQVIKGWVDKVGKSHEKVYDVAWSDNRKKDAKGKVPAVGSTVDLKTATYTNTIGAPILSTVWTDPDFDAGQRAFYYVRVIEIPTPRWTAYDAAFFKQTLPDFVPMTTQERAYTSPIWYTP